MLNRMFAILGLIAAVLVSGSALADDWVAVKLRGEVLQLVDGDWAELSRGDVVSDDRMVRTTANGRVEFRRDSETISLGANTQVQIRDKVGARYTTVQQHFGTVGIEAEVRNVQHFAVETPLLAAVVKGTRFIVKAGKAEASVQVKRGKVEVTDRKTGAYALIPAGQTVTVSDGGKFVLKGRGAGDTTVYGVDGTIIAGEGLSIGASVGPGGVSAGVKTGIGVSAGVTAGTGGIAAEAGVGEVAGVEAGVDDGGVSVGANVGGTNVGVNVGGGNGVSVTVGGTTVGLGLGGLL